MPNVIQSEIDRIVAQRHHRNRRHSKTHTLRIGHLLVAHYRLQVRITKVTTVKQSLFRHSNSFLRYVNRKNAVNRRSRRALTLRDRLFDRNRQRVQRRRAFRRKIYHYVRRRRDAQRHAQNVRHVTRNGVIIILRPRAARSSSVSFDLGHGAYRRLVMQLANADGSQGLLTLRGYVRSIGRQSTHARRIAQSSATDEVSQ